MKLEIAPIQPTQAIAPIDPVRAELARRLDEYDYSSLSPEVANTVKMNATEAAFKYAKASEFIWETGQHLNRVKADTQHGFFTPFLDWYCNNILGCSAKTGQNMMRIQLQFNDKSQYRLVETLNKTDQNDMAKMLADKSINKKTKAEVLEAVSSANAEKMAETSKPLKSAETAAIKAQHIPPPTLSPDQLKTLIESWLSTQTDSNTEKLSRLRLVRTQYVDHNMLPSQLERSIKKKGVADDVTTVAAIDALIGKYENLISAVVVTMPTVIDDSDTGEFDDDGKNENFADLDSSDDATVISTSYQTVEPADSQAPEPSPNVTESFRLDPLPATPVGQTAPSLAQVGQLQQEWIRLKSKINQVALALDFDEDEPKSYTYHVDDMLNRMSDAASRGANAA